MSHVVATAGHVDHGKSALVRALTGMEPDRLAEERRRGMTLDLGFAWTDVDGEPVAFVDVPGHERFVTTMLAGVGPVPAVLFVVAADEGWMPQSAEHRDALAAVGVRHGVLAVTRSDLRDPAPAMAAATAELAASPMGALPAVAVSSVTGAGLAELRAELAALVHRLPAPDPAADVRIWVDRAFTVRGAGTVVTGTLPAGTVRVGDTLVLAGAAGEREVVVRGLQSRGTAVGSATGVERVALNLRGVPVEGIARGDVLLTPQVWRPTAELDVRLVRADAVPEQLMLHVGAAAVPVRVRPLGADVVRLRLRRPLPLRIGDRAALRDPGRRQVVAGVVVLDPAPPALRRRGAAARRASDLGGATGVPDAAAELARRGLVRGADLVALGVPAAQVAAVEALRAGGWLVDPDRVPALTAAVRDAVAAHARAAPLEPGMPLDAARRAADLPDAAIVAALVAGTADLRTADGRVTAGGPALPPALATALAALRADLGRDPFAAPDAARLAELGLGHRELAALERVGAVLKVADGVVLLPGADAQALDRLRTLDGAFTLSAARQALGTTRRVAVPLLELLARTGRTRRTADGLHEVV
ncbi:selenocysteine-specific translation elongation factor [Pseudonocardia sp. CA-107938]|uniref:selenocysteine-specific translation elongation factor n=1 Tax=Pseudonocardia sp. CA-107938 TaxID=3240021 RepID=UPI003D8BC3CB